MIFNSFIDLILFLHAHKKDTVAFVDASNDSKVSYSELLQKIATVTEQLRTYSLQSGDAVILYKLKNIDWIIHFLACQCLGILVIPVDNRLNHDFLKEVVSSTRAKMIFSSHRFSLGSIKIVVPKSKKVIPNIDTHQFFKTLKTDQKKNQKNKIAEIIFTSGTWSRPKGVILTEKNLMSNLSTVYNIYKVGKNQTFLSILPLSHIYEQMCCLLMPLANGSTIVHVSEITGESIKSAVKKYSITYAVVVPKILETFRRGILKKLPKNIQKYVIYLNKITSFLPIPIRRKIFNSVHIEIGSSLTHFIVSGAPLTSEVDYFFQGLGYTIVVGYGLSETSPVITISQKSSRRVQGEVGQVIPSLQLKINKKNEILVTGPSIYYGYWPNKRTEKWFNTGDLGYLDYNKNLVLTGRSKNLVIYPSGDKVFLEEIEDIANSFNSIEESCCLYHEEHFKGTLDLLIRSENRVDSDQLKKFVRNRLPASVSIDRILNIYPEYLTRTHTLKLKRHEIFDKIRLDSQNPNTQTNATG